MRKLVTAAFESLDGATSRSGVIIAPYERAGDGNANVIWSSTIPLSSET